MKNYKAQTTAIAAPDDIVDNDLMLKKINTEITHKTSGIKSFENVQA